MRRRIRGSRGFVLPIVLVASMLGLFVVLSVAVGAAQNLLNHGRIEDHTRDLYAAQSLVTAVMEDLKRGADAVPLPPNTYPAPSIDFAVGVPSVDVTVFESRILATVKPKDYKVAAAPVVLLGFNPSGAASTLYYDDDSYYEVTDAGTPPSLSFEVTSEPIGFSTVAYGSINVIALSTKSSTKLDIYIYNPDDPSHTNNGYNPVPDITEVLDLANVEESIPVQLESADLTYVNSLPTKTAKVKIVATRTGGFKLRSDRVAFTMAGTVTTDERNVVEQPQVNSGTWQSGSYSELNDDDLSYYQVSSYSNVVEFEVTSDTFSFSNLDTVQVEFVAQSNKAGVTLELYVYNPQDPNHTVGGYDNEPDIITTIPLQNTDKAVSLSLAAADIAYLNSIFPIVAKVKVRATFNTSFQLASDMLVFIATSTSAPAQITQQITAQYVDPGLKHPAFATVPGHQGYLLRIWNVKPGALDINWAAHTADFDTIKRSVMVFRGLVVDHGVVVAPGVITSPPPATDNDLLVAVSSRPREGWVRTGLVDVQKGLYTIVFYNDSNKTLISDPFAATGDKANTWVYVPAFKDYLIDAKVGGAGIKAIVRQVPGPTEPPAFPWSRNGISWMENMVLLQSWDPYGAE